MFGGKRIAALEKQIDLLTAALIHQNTALDSCLKWIADFERECDAVEHEIRMIPFTDIVRDKGKDH